MTIVRDFEKLRNFVAKINLKSSAKLISVDGFSGAGKGMVSTYLNDILSIPVIYIDDFFPRDGKFLESFKFENFSAAITKLNQNSSVIVDGIMVQDILARLNIKPDLLVYVKRMNQYGIWLDSFKLDKFIRQGEDNDTSKFDLFEDQLVQYHLRVCPHERADIVVELVEGTV
jgi:uridine kinase